MRAIDRTIGRKDQERHGCHVLWACTVRNIMGVVRHAFEETQCTIYPFQAWNQSRSRVRKQKQITSLTPGGHCNSSQYGCCSYPRRWYDTRFMADCMTNYSQVQCARGRCANKLVDRTTRIAYRQSVKTSKSTTMPGAAREGVSRHTCPVTRPNMMPLTTVQREERCC